MRSKTQIKVDLKLTANSELHEPLARVFDPSGKVCLRITGHKKN